MQTGWTIDQEVVVATVTSATSAAGSGTLHATADQVAAPAASLRQVVVASVGVVWVVAALVLSVASSATVLDTMLVTARRKVNAATIATSSDTLQRTVLLNRNQHVTTVESRGIFSVTARR